VSFAKRGKRGKGSRKKQLCLNKDPPPENQDIMRRFQLANVLISRQGSSTDGSIAIQAGAPGGKPLDPTPVAGMSQVGLAEAGANWSRRLYWKSVLAAQQARHVQKVAAAAKEMADKVVIQVEYMENHPCLRDRWRRLDDKPWSFKDVLDSALRKIQEAKQNALAAPGKAKEEIERKKQELDAAKNQGKLQAEEATKEMQARTAQIKAKQEKTREKLERVNADLKEAQEEANQKTQLMNAQMEERVQTQNNALNPSVQA